MQVIWWSVKPLVIRLFEARQTHEYMHKTHKVRIDLPWEGWLPVCNIHILMQKVLRLMGDWASPEDGLGAVGATLAPVSITCNAIGTKHKL